MSQVYTPPETERIECPCCKGSGNLKTYEPDLTSFISVRCCHCVGSGYITDGNLTNNRYE